ncbi:hypothetical protein L1049_025840 [Liquidambar formosana]|uniref:Uncharacterized protein n=1 Tax=Liquidambar formosana TaxID=63359 RepID=A0AAP0NCJ4_LIQFO
MSGIDPVRPRLNPTKEGSDLNSKSSWTKQGLCSALQRFSYLPELLSGPQGTGNMDWTALAESYLLSDEFSPYAFRACEGSPDEQEVG